MPTDSTTFFLAFLAIFGGIAGYLYFLERQVRRLEARLAALETEDTSPSGPDLASRGSEEH